MKKTYNLVILLFTITIVSNAQFHTLKIPQNSNYVKETQRLGVTDITIEYHSPSINNRDVWNNNDVIPQNGEPIAWRAGANMNTTITFSTDVMLEGKPLKAGKYGFHVLPSDGEHTLIFAHSNDLWGSYYLDMDKDVTLQVQVTDTVCTFSEKLDYEFIPRSNSSMVIGLEWGEKRIPFEVSVDLNQTVVASFRSELRGINTYRWEAWNDAANWCLANNTNLEEALEWTERSMEGGYGGFAANRNLTNLRTQAAILSKLGRKEEFQETIKQALSMDFDQNQANYFTIFLLRNNDHANALTMSSQALEKYPDQWYLQLNHGISLYFNKRKKEALKTLAKAKERTPDSFQARLEQIIDQVEAGTFKL